MAGGEDKHHVHIDISEYRGGSGEASLLSPKLEGIGIHCSPPTGTAGKGIQDHRVQSRGH